MEEKQSSAMFSARIHTVATLLVAMIFAVILFRLGTGLTKSAENEWELPLLMTLTAVSTLTALARQLQWQYVLAAAFIAALVGSLAHTFSVNSGIPFGPFVFGPAAGPQFFDKLPWTVPVIWIVVLFNSRGVGRLILRPWRKMKTYGFWLIGLTVALSTLFDLGMDPFVARMQHYWLWSPTKFPVTWAGAPIINFLGWMFVSLLVFAFATPVLIKKQPGQRSTPDYHPLGIWIGGLTLFAIASGMHGYWGAAALDVIAVAVSTPLAVRGAKW
jgi:uncharacterized membrane protein